MPLYVCEGIDGCGKSTQAKRLATHLRNQGREVLELREPGGTTLGERIRAVLLDPATEAGAVAELFGYQMARAQLCEAVIAPALSRGVTVVLDRFWYSTVAYQAFGLGLEESAVRAVLRLATGAVKVDQAFWFDVPVEVAQRRRALARGQDDRIEARGSTYLERVANGYRSMAERGELLRIDAQDTAELVTERMLTLFGH